MLKKALAAAVLFTAVAALAGTLADDVVTELYAMKSVYSAQYAPGGWKKQYAGYDLDAELKKAIAAAQSKSNLSIDDSRRIFSDFVYAIDPAGLKWTWTRTGWKVYLIRSAGGRLLAASLYDGVLVAPHATGTAAGGHG